jgi:GntR family transcriptional regulator
MRDSRASRDTVRPGYTGQPYPPTVGYVTIDPISETPMYVQLADVLRAQIQSGEIAQGHPLPSLETLRQQYEIARGTAAKAVRVLVAEGLVVQAPGKGAFVRRR